MFRVICARLRQGYHTKPFPIPETALSDRYPGRPEIADAAWTDDEFAEVDAVCPVAALRREAGRVAVDLGRCIFCGRCAETTDKIKFSRHYRMAAARRDDLIVKPGDELALPAAALKQEMQRLFGRSLKLRQVCAGGCNACEADVNVLNTLVWDLGRFGIQFVASPRHADGVLVTGPVTQNMKAALQKTYDAVATPKLVIATGACAISGGIYEGHEEACNGVASMLPVDLYIPGCPPHPATILDGLLRLMGRLK